MRESRQEGGEPRKNFRVGQAPRFLWFAVCVFFCVLSLGEIWNSFHDPQYQWLFGGEGPVAGVPWYRSHYAYVWFLAGESCWYLAGMGLSLAARKRPGLFVCHVILSVLWIMYLQHQF